MGWNEFVQIIAATAGTLGFALAFNIRGKKVFVAAFGGCFGWVLFLLMGLFLESEVLRYFIASLLVSIYGEVMARLLKTPTIIFNIVCLVPFVPGGSLYYTMTNAFSGDLSGFLKSGSNTLQLAAALSFGVVIVSTFTAYLTKHMHRLKIKKRLS